MRRPMDVCALVGSDLVCGHRAGLLAIFLLNLYQVGGRYLFGIGEVWIPDVTRFLFIWMVFFGTALMHLRKRHLVIDCRSAPYARAGSAGWSRYSSALGMLGMTGAHGRSRLADHADSNGYSRTRAGRSRRGMRIWPCRWPRP